MQSFQFLSAKSVSEAIRFLAENGDRAKIIAGGTDLIPRLREEISHPAFVLNILEIEELHGIQEMDHALRIGSAVTHAEIMESDLVNRICPSLAQAAAAVGGPLVRNRGTIGGSIVNASPAADLASALLALGAEVVLLSERGARTVGLGDFFAGPGITVCQPDELLAEISVPLPKGRDLFLKLGRREAMSLSIVNVAVYLKMEDRKCRQARIAMGAVAPTPVRCFQAEKLLINRDIDREMISRCAKEALTAISPIDDQRAKAWYRSAAGEVLLKRALAEAAGLQT